MTCLRQLLAWQLLEDRSVYQAGTKPQKLALYQRSGHLGVGAQPLLSSATFLQTIPQTGSERLVHFLELTRQSSGSSRSLDSSASKPNGTV